MHTSFLCFAAAEADDVPASCIDTATLSAEPFVSKSPAPALLACSRTQDSQTDHWNPCH